MKLFLDGACLEDIRKWAPLLDGVTTNPTLLAKAKVCSEDFIRETVRLISGSVSVQIAEKEDAAMVEEGQRWHSFGPKVTLKLCVTPRGLRVCRKLVDAGIPVNMTLCFSVLQAFLAAKAGATYVSVFMGRLEDAGQDSVAILHGIREIYTQNAFKSQILAASIRNPLHLSQALMAGADVATVPVRVLEEAVAHPLTVRGMELFNNS